MSLYLVTGGAGFIGSHIAEALVRRGDRVRVLDDLSSGNLENLAGLEIGSHRSGAPVEFMRGSIVDANACESACEGVKGVLHEAAQVSVPRSIEDPLASYEINVSGTLRLLEAARHAGVDRFVFAASSAAYGNTVELPKIESMVPQPLSPYASGKVAGEHLLRVYAEVYGMRTIALRYFNIFGERQADDSPYTGVIALFAKALLEGRRPTIFGDGEQTRDFTYVENVVQANLEALAVDTRSALLVNIGGGERISINSLYSTMAMSLGKDIAPVYLPARAGDVRDSLASVELARSKLGYEPRISWREGLERTVRWYRERFASSSR